MGALVVAQWNSCHIFFELSDQCIEIGNKLVPVLDPEQRLADGIELVADALLLIDLVAPGQELVEYSDDFFNTAHFNTIVLQGLLSQQFTRANAGVGCRGACGAARPVRPLPASVPI